jgi:hypothetical protein
MPKQKRIVKLTRAEDKVADSEHGTEDSESRADGMPSTAHGTDVARVAFGISETSARTSATQSHAKAQRRKGGVRILGGFAPRRESPHFNPHTPFPTPHW